MTTETSRELKNMELPYRRRASLRRVDFESGMSMVRLVLREGTRITQIDLDAASATELGEAMIAAARDM